MGLAEQYRAFRLALTALYEDDHLHLDKAEMAETFDSEKFDKAARAIYEKRGFSPQLLSEPAMVGVIEETARVLGTAIDSALPHEVPDTLRYALEENAFIFSGLKTFHSLREVGLSLTDDKGNIKPFVDFWKDVERINDTYNKNYLRAEYQQAVGASMMAAKWVEYTEDGDRYDLQYRTAGDERVRASHASLDGITLPPSDPFWSSYFAPNGWGCRCDVVQVRAGKYERTDSEAALKLGEECTATPKLAMFRFNPGQTMQLFPPKHPYNKAPKGIVERVVKFVTQKRMDKIAEELPDNLTEEEKRAVAQNCIDIEKALKIKKGKTKSVEQADKQNANPHLNKGGGFTTNCQTCSPAYMLRLRGFNLTAKKKTKGSKLEYLSLGRSFEVWKNVDGTPAKHISQKEWMEERGYKKMTPRRYKEFFDETCREVGVYQLSIAWKSGGGHATILQRFENGELRYIEPQRDNSEGSGREHLNIDYLAGKGGSTIHACRGIMRIDNKIFDISFLDIFERSKK